MRQEIKTFKITCDRCKKKETVYSNWNFCSLPEGWGTEDITNCGLTNYTRSDDLCTVCYQSFLKE